MLIKSKNWADLCPIISKLLKQKFTVISSNLCGYNYISS